MTKPEKSVLYLVRWPDWVKGFMDYMQENNTCYSNYINQQTQLLNDNQERLNQTEGQLTRDINDTVKVVLNKIIHQIEDN